MPRQPLYPHIPKSRRVNRDTKLRFMPDSPEEISLTIEGIGYRAKLEKAFTQAIARAKGA